MLRRRCFLGFIAAAVLSADAAAQGAKGPDYTPWVEWFRGKGMVAQEGLPLPTDNMDDVRGPHRVIGGYRDDPNVTESPTVAAQGAYVIELPDEKAALELFATETPRWRRNYAYTFPVSEPVELPDGAAGLIFRNPDGYNGQQSGSALGELGGVRLHGLIRHGKRVIYTFSETHASNAMAGDAPMHQRRVRSWERLRPFALAEMKALMAELVGVEEEVRPIIFIHGIGGSVLARNWLFFDSQLWPFALVDDRKSLMLDRNGQGSLLSANVHAPEAMRGAGIFATVYGPLMEFFERSRRSAGRDLWYFPYDWRLDNAEHLPLLDRLVDDVLAKTRKKKVNLVTHSMGGLVAKGYVHGPGAAKVSKLISIALPYRGGGFVFRGLADGYNFGNDTARTELMKILLQNWPSGYQIYPRYPFIVDAATGTPLTAEQAHAIRYYGYKGAVENWIWPDVYTLTDRPEWVNNDALVKRADAYHRRFNAPDGSPAPLPPGVKHYAIVGWGLSTEVGYAMVDEPDAPHGQGYLHLDHGTTPPRERTVNFYAQRGDGDGKVPLRESSDFGGASKFFYIRHQHAGGAQSAEHTEITWNTQVHTILDRLLSNRPVPPGAYDTPPTELDSLKALHGVMTIANRSAVTLRIRDTAGQATLGRAPTKGAPAMADGHLLRLGGLEHAWLPPSGGPFEVELQGIRDGKFTISVEVNDAGRRVVFGFPTLDAKRDSTGRFTLARDAIAAARVPVLEWVTDGRTTRVPARPLSPAEAAKAFGPEVRPAPGAVKPALPAAPVAVTRPRPAESSTARPEATTNQPAAPAMVPREPGEARVLDFRFVDKSRDEVSASGNAVADGAPDGWFKLTLELPPQTEIQRIGIAGANAQGRFAEHYWTTQPGVNWVIGVAHAGARLNQTHVRSLGRLNGVVTLDLFAADPRWFVPGNWVTLEVVLGDGTRLTGLCECRVTPAGEAAAVVPESGGPAMEGATARPSTAPPERGGTPSEAKRQALEQVRAQPASAEAWIALGIAHNYDGKTAEAIAAYERAQRIAPHTPNLNTWLAELHIARRDWPAARRVIEAEIGAQPRSGWAVSWLGTLEHEAGNAERARAAFARAAQLDRAAAGFRYQNALRLAAARQPRRALSDFIAVSLMDPQHGPAYFGMAQCYALLGMNEAAATYYEHYLRLDAASEWARQARAELGRLRGKQ